MLKRNFLLYALILIPVSRVNSNPTTWHTTGKIGVEVGKNFNSVKNKKGGVDILLTGYLTRNNYIKGGVSLSKLRENRALKKDNVSLLGILSYHYSFYDYVERLFINGTLGVSIGKKKIDVILGTELELVALSFSTLTLGMTANMPMWKGKGRFIPFWVLQLGIKFTF